MRGVACTMGGVLLALLGGCSSDDESFIDANISETLPGTGEPIDRVRLRVERIDDPITERYFAKVPVRTGATIAPMSFRVAPERARDPGATLYRFRADALVGDSVVVSQQHSLVFLPGSTLLLPIRFDSACVRVMCDGGTTCVEGRCVDDFIPSCDLEGAPSTGLCARDAGRDLGTSMDARPSDAALDAARDLGPTDLGNLDAFADEPDATSSECVLDAECDDRDACTDDACESGVCNHRGAVCADDGNTCTSAMCDPSMGCRHAPLGDGATCGGGGTCCAGACVTTTNDAEHCGDCGTRCGGTTPACIGGACGRCARDGDCDDGGLACRTAICMSGACTYDVLPGTCLIDGACRTEGERSPANECLVCASSADPTSWSSRTGGCDDGFDCTQMDICADGACAGRPRSCSDGFDCTTDACSETGGCASTLRAGRCLIAGSCFFDGDPNPGAPCEACDSGASPTAWSATSSACDDGMFCTTGESCTSGTCGAGASRDCSDGATCTTDTCNETANQCDHVLVANTCRIASVCYAEGERNPANQCQYCATGLSTIAWSSRVAQSCDLGLFCSTTDICTFDGDCIEDTLRSCADGLSCTTDSCNEAMDRCDSTIMPGFCVIAGQCWTLGDANPINWCQQCLPAMSQTSWSTRDCPEFCCDTHMLCVPPGYPCP